MGVRELIILILGLAVIAVILRGLYIALQARRNQIRLAIDKNIPRDVDLNAIEMAELPNGGARVARRSLDAVNRQNSLQNEFDLVGDDPVAGSVPILMDKVEVRAPATRVRPAASVPAAGVVVTSQAGRFDAEDEDEYEEEGGDDYLWDEDEDDLDQEDEDVREGDDYMEDEEDDEQDDFDDYEDDDYKDEDEDDVDFDEDDEDYLRRDPGLDPEEEFDEEFENFSMTAGERIGGPVAGESSHTPKPARASRADPKDSLLKRFGRERPPERDRDRSLPLEAGRRQQNAVQHESRVARQEPRTARREASAVTAQTEQRAPVPGRAAEHVRKSEPGGAAAGVADFKQARESRKVTPTPQQRAVEPAEVVVVNVMSRDGAMFHGSELLQALTMAGLRFGDMNIFHKHLHGRIDGPVVFSVANILNPGIFDLDAMDSLVTKGVSLFLAMPCAINNLEAFELMLDTAKQIRSALGGELRDDHRNVMTLQTIEHYRQRIRDYELRKLKAAHAQS